MEAEFWQKKWKNQEIAFNQSEANPLLVRYFGKLALAKGSRVFLPLCGKTTDALWLLSEGYSVVGAELVESAIQDFFSENDLHPEVTSLAELKVYRSENIDMFVGDIFHLTFDLLGKVNATYDRAALVALPEEMRRRYTKHLVELTNQAPQLLITFEYDQGQMSGPPFSISSDEVHSHYDWVYQLQLLETRVIPDGLKGHSANEVVWMLR